MGTEVGCGGWDWTLDLLLREQCLIFLVILH